MPSGQFIWVGPTGDPSHGGANRVPIPGVDLTYGDATVIHASSGDTVDGTDRYVDYVTLDAVNVTSSTVTLRIFIAGEDYPIDIDVPPRGSPPIFINARPWPLAKGMDIRGTVIGAAGGEIHVGCRVDRFQQAA